MNNFSNSPIDVIAHLETQTKQIQKEIKEFFKHKINGSFLIKIEHKILETLGTDIFQYYSMQFNKTMYISGIMEAPNFDICKIIIGIHRHHSIFLTEEEIRNNQRSEKYQKQIVDEVIEKIRLRKYGSTYYRRYPFSKGEEFLYFPVPYELFAICMRSFELLCGENEKELIDYGNILKCALSVLTLMENNFLSSAYPLCRGMIEQYVKLLLIGKHPECYDEYNRFCKFEIDQSCCSKKYPDEFLKLYRNRHFQSHNSKVDYLHYGWLDFIDEYNINVSKPYSLYGIINYLQNTVEENLCNSLTQIKSLYKMCHGYAHGSANDVKYPLVQYFEICEMLYLITTSIFTSIHNVLNIDFSQEDTLLLETLYRDFHILETQHGQHSTDNYELYYSIHNS